MNPHPTTLTPAHLKPPAAVAGRARVAARPLAVRWDETGEVVRCPIRKFRIQLPDPLRQSPGVRRIWRVVAGVCWLGLLTGGHAAGAPRSATVEPSALIEAAGRVECLRSATTNWQPARVGLTLLPGDRVRTGPRSRAAVQLSDRSVVRLSEQTTLELLPPRRAEKRRFGLPRGTLFFFNRERPADVEFETPLASGAIRGTEFLLTVDPGDAALHLALVDGLVALDVAGDEVRAERGEAVLVRPGQPVQRTVLTAAVNAIQWALYYPAVLDPTDLHWPAEVAGRLREVLVHYEAGDGIAALAAWPADLPETADGSRTLRAALELAVGRVTPALTALEADATPAARALRTLIATIQGTPPPSTDSPASTSELLAQSYLAQSRGDVVRARQLAAEAVRRSPRFGIGRARLAELAYACGDLGAAQRELEAALDRSPRLTSAHALRGFLALDRSRNAAALAAFDHALELDAAFGPAWLGRGLALMQRRQWAAARAAFQAAAALEPQRALFRSYLGKAASELGDDAAAAKELALAKRWDANDPTAWLYSALHLWQRNRLNEALRDLEQSAALNDARAPFRSRLLLDTDRSVRSADLAALYGEAGLFDVSHRAASRAVTEDPANFSGHLFLARSYQALEDDRRFNLRLEAPRQSELLVANLLAPPGAGNLSQQLSQQEHLRLFDARPTGLSTRATYASSGDWSQQATAFGTVAEFTYALDVQYAYRNGQQVHDWAERQQVVLTAKQRLGDEDEAYVQVGHLDLEAGDLGDYYDPAAAKAGFHVAETQAPTLYAGWHHTWSPGSHTLFLAARLDDQLDYRDPQPSLLFLRQSGGSTAAVETPPFFELASESRFTLYSAELQQLWTTPRFGGLLGGRWQSGTTDTHATLARTLTGVVTDQALDLDLERRDLYAYGWWRPIDSLHATAGISYNHFRFPENVTLPPLIDREDTRDAVSPKVGLTWVPWTRGRVRAAYTRSLGGLFFDSSVRLEPTQVGGFNQMFRSLAPESVAGLVPGTEFETLSAGFDQALAGSTWFGVELEQLTSKGDRTVGVLTNSTFLPIPDAPSGTRQTLDFRERNASCYAAHLVSEYLALSGRYRFSEARLRGRFPDIPDAATGLEALEQDQRAGLHQLTLSANAHLPGGWFGRWESAWHHQHNSGDTPARRDEDFWQHHLTLGYRLPRRHAELTVRLLNLLDTDYRLNPLNLHGELPRRRTLVASLRLHF